VSTLQQFSLYVRQRSAVENDTVISSDEMTSLCNGALSDLYGLLVTRYEDYFLNAYVSVLQDGYYQIPLPPDLMKIRAVDYNNAMQDSNLWFTINQFQFPERNQFNTPYTSALAPWAKIALSWRLTQDNILISPASQANGIYRIWYVPQYVPLVNQSDTIPANMDQNGWTEYAVATACIRIMNKLHLESQAFETERAELRQRIQSEAKNRQGAGGKRIANVTGGQYSLFPTMGSWNDY
jgi:hypothetical protein